MPTALGEVSAVTLLLLKGLLLLFLPLIGLLLQIGHLLGLSIL